jgi:8-oxo-dGTP diphosphatase
MLAKREARPFMGSWALPGGVLRIDLDDDLEAAVRRVARERLRVPIPYLRQQCAVGGKGRDTRARWALSIVYRTLLRANHFDPQAGKRVADLKWTSVAKAQAAKDLAFDHAQIIGNAAAALRQEVEALELPMDYLPQQFTLGELQLSCEELLGRKLDKSSFRRRIADRDLLVPVDEIRQGPNRPAQVYRFKALSRDTP